MRNYLLIFVSVLLLFSGCAIDTLREDDLTFDLADDMWNDFEYFDHVMPERSLDIEFRPADDRSLFLC